MTDWSQFVQYFCRHCATECINRLDTEPTRAKECRECFDDPSLDAQVQVTHHLPDSATNDRGDLQPAE